MDVHLTATRFKPLIFSVLVFMLSQVAKGFFLDFKLSLCSECCVLSFWVDSPVSELYVPTFRNTLPHLHRRCATTCFSTRTRPHHIPPPSDWLRLFSSHTFSRINSPTISSRLYFLLTPPMKMEQTQRSETSAYKIQMPANYPPPQKKKSIQQKIFITTILYGLNTELLLMPIVLWV